MRRENQLIKLFNRGNKWVDYPEYPIDNRLIFTAEVPKEKTLRFKGVLHSNLSYYSENSIRHPAKMSILLTKWILQKFTKDGETVIDPMSGIGTTLLEAVNMNRNCIAIELEKKFVDWVNENTKLLNKNKPIDKRGKGVVLQGDARNLTDILNKQADKIVFSPPYCETEAFHDQDFTLRSTKVNPSSRKISEQRYGKGADAVVTSPPFASSPRAGNKDKDEFWKNQEQRYNRKFTKSKKLLDSMHYSENPDNIGNLPKGEIDAIVTSPPHANTISSNKKEFERIKKLVETGKASKELARRYNDWLKNKDKNQGCQGHWESSYSGNKENIGNLPKGDIDVVVTSPPYAKAVSPFTGGAEVKPAIKIGCDNIRTGYSENPNNIGNLPKGDIDAVVTSPPYAKSVSTKGDPKKRAERMKKAGYDPKTIIGGKARCGEVDWQYSEDTDNIGNLPQGNIDTIITSPPYENTIREGQEGVNITSDKGRWKRKFSGKEKPSYFESKDNLGNLKKKSYLSEMKKVYDQCFSVLKQGGLAVLVTKNFVRNYKMIRLDMDTILLMESCGFRLIDRYFRAIGKPSFWILNYRKQCKKKGIPDPTAHFEDITVYKKGVAT